MCSTVEELEYREKLWNDCSKQIFLNESESNSFYEIMCNYLSGELEHYREYVETNGVPENHIIYDLLTVINGLSPSDKNEILIGYNVEDIRYKINKN